jgi:hypothetical protein
MDQHNIKTTDVFDRIGKYLLKRVPSIFDWRGFQHYEKTEDKSSTVFDLKWSNLFNVVIESLDLKEIVMSGRQFTWVGPGDNPTFEKLDRVLVSTDWEDKFPLSWVEPRDRNISDHTPLILNKGVHSCL